MIITANDLLSMGFRVSVDEDTIGRAIQDAELFYVKSVIGNANYITYTGTVEQGTNEYIYLNGGVVNGVHYAGLKLAVAHIAYAYLLRMNVNSTNFGSVRKYDENSSNIDEELLYSTTKHHFTIGKSYLRELLPVIGGDFNNANGSQFDEFNNLI